MTPLSETAKTVLAVLHRYPAGLDEVEISRELVGSLDSRNTEHLLMVGSVNAAMFNLRRMGLVDGEFMGCNWITAKGMDALVARG